MDGVVRMTDSVLITIYAALAAFVVATTVSFAVHGMHQKLSHAYYWISACMIGWLIVTIAFHISTQPQWAEYLDNLAFPFIAFLPVLLLLFIWHFFHGRKRLPKWAVALLCIIPAGTTVITVVPAFNWLMRSNYVLVQMSPLHVAAYTWNFWYYIHAGYCYLLMVLGVLLVVRQYKKQPREYKVPSILLLVGIGIICLSDLPSFNIPDAIVDNTLIGVSLSMVAMYFAIINNPAVELLAAARNALYNNMDVPVFILDCEERVLDMNRAAQDLIETLAIPSGEALTFGDIGRGIARFGGTVRNGFAQDGTSHILLSLHGEPVVLNQVHRELTDKKGRPLGSYVALMDVTGLSRFVDELQYRAEVDVLTGIPNRRAFERRSAELDVAENLPLSVIVGDVCRLKQVNDSLGHRQGDMLLKTIAGVLAAACPQAGFAARVGGDEFVMVIPGCDAQTAKEIEQAVHTELEKVKKLAVEMAIALGSVTKTRPEQDLKELIHQADQLMYAQKRYDRRSGPSRSEWAEGRADEDVQDFSGAGF